LWTNNNSYGFGFNASGAGSTGFFPTTDYFRPFANQSPSLIAIESTPTKNRQTTILYKAISSAEQGAGRYQTNIIYTAVPYY
jgi:hypothetical protein